MAHLFRVTLTMTITMTGLEAVRVLDDQGSTRKNLNTQRIDHKIRASLPFQYDFPYRYVFPANHPFSSYTQFLALPPAATPHHSHGGGGGGSSNYDLYAPVASPPFPSNLYQHQHLHQHQHQLQLQPPPPQPPPPPQQPGLPPQIAQPEFKYTLKPTSSNSHHPQHHAPPSNSLPLGPFQSGSAPTVLLLHATNPAAGSVQTFLLIPASTTDGGQSFNIGAPSYAPNSVNAMAGGAFSIGGTGGAGNVIASAGNVIAGAPQGTMTGAAAAAAAAAAHGGAPMPGPIVLRTAGHTKIANSHFHNQLSAAQLMTRPLGGGVYQLPLMPPNAKFYKRKKSSMEAKMSQAADGHGAESSSVVGPSTSTETSVPEIRNGHASRVPDQEDISSDTFEEYVPENGPLAPGKRS